MSYRRVFLKWLAGVASACGVFIITQDLHRAPGANKSTCKHKAGNELRCSFCNKSQNEVRKLIAGPTVFICDECIRVCNDIMEDHDVAAD